MRTSRAPDLLRKIFRRDVARSESGELSKDGHRLLTRAFTYHTAKGLFQLTVVQNQHCIDNARMPMPNYQLQIQVSNFLSCARPPHAQLLFRFWFRSSSATVRVANV